MPRKKEKIVVEPVDTEPLDPDEDYFDDDEDEEDEELDIEDLISIQIDTMEELIATQKQVGNQVIAAVSNNMKATEELTELIRQTVSIPGLLSKGKGLIDVLKAFGSAKKK